MTKDAVIVIRGKLHWPKLTGKARPYTGNPKYDKGPYWSVDVTPDAKSRALIKQFGISKKLRTPGEKDKREETFLTLKVLENKADGEKNSPPKIVDLQGQNWDDSKLIGNETVADVKIKIKDYGSGSEKGVYLQAIRILDHVPYEGGSGFAPLSEDDEFFGAASGSTPPATASDAFDPDLDDDIPF